MDRNEEVSTWALPENAVARLGRGTVSDIAFSADGEMLAVGSWIGVWLYDRSTLAPLALWDTERGVVKIVDFSPNGAWLATGNWDGVVKVWDVWSQRCICKMQRGGPFDAASQLAFSPDGQRLACSGGRYDAVYIWDVATGEAVATFNVDEPRPRFRPYIPLAFTLCGDLIAAATPGNAISVWAIEAGERIACLTGHTEIVVALAFSPCGRFIASGDRKGTLHQWDVSTACQVGDPVRYSKNTVIPSWTQEGILRAAAIYKETVAVWDVEHREKLVSFDSRDEILGWCFSRGIDFAVASTQDFKVWCDTTGTVSTISGHTPCLSLSPSLTFLPNGHALAAVDAAGVTCWDVNKRHPHQVIKDDDETRIAAIHISGTGNMLALGRSGEGASMWEVEIDQPPAALQPSATLSEPYKYGGRVAAFSPTGEFWASVVEDNTVCIWNGKGKETELVGHTEPIGCIAFASTEKQVATVARDRTARVWDVASGKEIVSLPLTLPLHKSSSWRNRTPKQNARDSLTLPLHKNSPFPISLLEPTVYKGDPDVIHSLLNEEKPRGHPPEIKAITFSPCGTLIAAGLQGGIRIWDAKTYEPHMVILLPEIYGRQFALAFSPCSRYLASGAWWWHTEKVPIYLWCVASGENIATFWGHPTDVQDIAFSPDGSLLASGGFDGTILLWDLKLYLPHETSK